MTDFFGLAAGLLGILAYGPYLRDICARRTAPHRASWLIWSALASISFASQLAQGAADSLWFSAVQTLVSITVFLASLAFGTGRVFTKWDVPVLLAAGAGLWLWYLTDTPGYALAISIGISTIGGLPTVLKAYRAPSSETLPTWLYSAAAAVMALAAVGQLDALLMAYPAYILGLSTAVSGAILLGRVPATTATVLLPPSPEQAFSRAGRGADFAYKTSYQTYFSTQTRHF